MKRVCEQQESIGQAWLRSSQHGRLAASVGVPAQKQPPRNLPPHYLHHMPQSLLVARGAAAWRRPVRMPLTKRKVAAENSQAGFAEGVRQRHQQQGLAVRAGAVREDQPIPR